MTNDKVKILYQFQNRRTRPVILPESQIQGHNTDEPNFYSRRVYRKLKRNKKPNDLVREIGFLLKRTKKTVSQQTMQEEDQNENSNSENPMIIENFQ